MTTSAPAKVTRQTLITPIGLAFYPNVFTAHKAPNSRPEDKPRYQITLLYTKEGLESEEFKAIKQACLLVATEKFGPDALREMLSASPSTFRWPWRTDIAQKGFNVEGPEVYVAFISPWSTNQPDVVGPYGDASGKPVRLTDPKQVYSGISARASVRPFAYDERGQRGVQLGLQNVQKTNVKEAKRLTGRPDGADEFGVLETGPAPMDTTSLPTAGTVATTKSELTDLLGGI